MKKTFILGTLFLMLLAFGLVYADETPKNLGPTKLQNALITGDEDYSHIPQGPSWVGATRSPGFMLGDTYYDYQHNGSMGRQVAYGNGADCHALHFNWMELPCAGGARNIKYNAWNFASNTWAWSVGTGGGKSISDDNGGYCSMDVTYGGSAVPGFHSGVSGDFYSAKASSDDGCPLGFFDYGTGAPDPPNCEGWATGSYEPNSVYIWPKVEYDQCGSDEIIHMIATESPPSTASAGEIQTLVYNRLTRSAGTGAYTYPACATAIDSMYNITGIVRENPTNDDVSIVWMKPIHYDGDPNDPCGFTQWQNDVVMTRSTDCGQSWPRTPENYTVNISDYTQGGTLAINQVTELAYTDLSAIYDETGTFHVVWSTPLRNLNDEPCNPLYASRIWHWDDSPGGCVTLVYDASTPRFMMDPGAWNNSTCKMNISECGVDGTTRLYCSFTRFGMHTSANGDTSADASAGGYENGDIVIVGSSDGGVTWSPAVNITNTQTDGCAAGECESEHWSTMAAYSTDSVHIEYMLDIDAGGFPQTEGEMMCTPVMYVSHPCFPVEEFCAIAYTPIAIDYPTHIAPNDGSTDCTSDLTTTFDVTVTNTGNLSTSVTATPNQSWLVGGGTQTVNAGCSNSHSWTFTIGPIADEGIYDAEISLTACGGEFTATINVRVYVYCYFYVPEYEIISTACWSVGVWNNMRAGTAQWNDPEGNMYWFIDEVALMYDESLIIAYEDTCQTYFSMFDGSDDDVDMVALSYLTTATFPTYEYAHALWGTGDTNITGEVEYFMPIHPDTCVLVERVKICNNEAVAQTIHVGEGIDWDIPDGADGSNNQCGYDGDRKMLYQYGPPGTPEEAYHGGAAFCHDIPGGSVFMNDIWVYDNSGYEPCEVGGYIARASTFDLAPADSVEDLNTVYAVFQDLTLEPGQCTVFCKVKASSLTDLAHLQSLIDIGFEWIISNEIDCPGCGGEEPGCEDPEMIGDANGSGYPDPGLGIDIDDVVYLIAYIFTGGPNPTPYAIASGDANCSGGVDIDDVVFEIAYIFTGGDAPCTCDEWVATYGPLQ